MTDNIAANESSALEDIIARKREEVRQLRAAGTDVFPHRLPGPTVFTAQAKTSQAGTEISCAGRVVQLRLMGKAAFAHIQDTSGKLQLYFKKDTLGEQNYDFFKKHVHVGDYIFVSGKMFLTHTNEITLAAEKMTLLSKAMRPMPEKWHGIQDTEIRYRMRHLDLLANAEVRDIFILRSKLVSSVRRTLDSKDFLEVETPILCASAGGASATPFETYLRALKMPLFMRIATELYLKRLIIGGLERVYEIGRVFRNEGLDTRHNPEFTTLEVYQAYTDYNGMMQLLEDIFSGCAAALGKDSVEYRGVKISLKPPYRRLSLPDAWKEHCGEDIHNILQGKTFNRANLESLAKRFHIEHGADTPSAKIFDRIFDAKIVPLLEQPVFLMDYPTAITPLAKLKGGDPCITERFEFFAAGMEMANAYTELNDPDDQLERLQEQMRQKQAEHNEEVDVIDKDFVEAMEAGMPPTGGMGIGIDRMAMLFSGNPSIREVILFPTLKAETAQQPPA
ncbi:MAG TPA: lysine--tRNA ligase [Elusimicrobiales bacterium]|nr:lysine--tRNA ligase [Elusimicrobiales bacterium]